MRRLFPSRATVDRATLRLSSLAQRVAFAAAAGVTTATLVGGELLLFSPPGSEVLEPVRAAARPVEAGPPARVVATVAAASAALGAAEP